MWLWCQGRTKNATCKKLPPKSGETYGLGVLVETSQRRVVVVVGRGTSWRQSDVVVSGCKVSFRKAWKSSPGSVDS